MVSIMEWKDKAAGCIQLPTRHLSPRTASHIAAGRERRPRTSVYPSPGQADGFVGVRIGREKTSFNSPLTVLPPKRARGKPAPGKYSYHR